MSEASAPASVMIVEDEAKLAAVLADYLHAAGYLTHRVSNGIEAAAAVRRLHPDLVLLDLALPGKDGIDVCREIRAFTDTPIVMVTARGEEVDRVLGLEGGADDYVPKPFSSRELLARVRAQARRRRGDAGPRRRLEVGRIAIDTAAMTATLDGAPLALTTYEFVLLRVLAERAGRVLSREQLVDLVRGSAEEAFDRSVDVHVSHLRAKLGDDPRNPRIIKTVRGAGYMLALERG